MEITKDKIEIKENTKNIPQYNMVCPRCKKELTAVSIKQLNHNYKLHKIFCGKDLLEVLEE